MLSEFAQQRPQQQPTHDDDPLATITQKRPVPPKLQARKQHDNDTDDLLSDITGGDREPLL
jgi:hypothetical protein